MAKPRTIVRRSIAVVAGAGLLAAAGILANAAASASTPSTGSTGGRHFVTTWGSSMQGLDSHFQTNMTARMIARVTVGGTRAKVRLSNAYGPAPLRIRSAYVGLSAGPPFTGSAVKKGTNVPLTFGGRRSVTIAPGAERWSDPSDLDVRANQNVAVSLYSPGRAVAVTEHSGALTASFSTDQNAGNHAAETSGTAFTQTTTAMWWVDAIAVSAPKATCAVVAFGDSITDGTGSTVNGHNRWEDFLARRVDDQGRRSMAVVNEGIGGNTITASPQSDIGPPGVDRQRRDVLSLPGVCDVILFMGTNDIAHGPTPARSIVSGMRKIIRRDRVAGLRTIGVTVLPRDLANGWNPAKMDPIRDKVNAFVRGSRNFDAVIDFDALLHDTEARNVLDPLYALDDHIHPNPYGYSVMGNSVDLGTLR